jgi:hypothetical protein
MSLPPPPQSPRDTPPASPASPLQAGLRGINLSGGQRQRLNLARCAYYDGDLVLLDNALSAVDHHTAQHIFEHCIKGMFRDKATILVTHQVRPCPWLGLLSNRPRLAWRRTNERHLFGLALPCATSLPALSVAALFSAPCPS